MEERAARGLRTLGVATSADEGASWQLLGLISLLDPPRDDTQETIRQANELGVEVSGCSDLQNVIFLYISLIEMMMLMIEDSPLYIHSIAQVSKLLQCSQLTLVRCLVLPCDG